MQNYREKIRYQRCERETKPFEESMNLATKVGHSGSKRLDIIEDLE